VDRYAKAVVGAILAGLGALSTALTDGITATEWVLVAIAVFGSFGMVWATKNTEPEPEPRPGLHERLMEDHT